MIAPSSAFHNYIKDPSTYKQNAVLVFNNGYFSGQDGDIESTGIEFDEYFCTEDDLQYGECPSATMRVSLINIDQRLRSFQWGECSAFIGCKVGESDTTVASGVNASITVGTTTFEARNTGFYIGSTQIRSGECYSLLLVSNATLYAFGNGYGYKVSVTSSGTYQTPVPYEANSFMNAKMRTPRAIEWNASNGVSTVYVTKGAVREEWQYIPMGVYYVGKPSNFSDAVIDTSECLDRMYLFNGEATDFLQYMASKYPKDGDTFPTALGWLAELTDYVGLTSGSTIPTGGVYYNPNTAQTLRDILGFIAETRKCNYRFNRVGTLTEYKVGTSMVEEVELRRIQESSLSTAEYVTRSVSKIVNKNASGLTYITGSGDNAYYIYGNPFLQNNSGLSLSDYAFYPYLPTSCVVLEADPCVEVGDKVGIWMTDVLYEAFIDAYDRVLTDDQGRVFTKTNTAIGIPLMHRLLNWNGVCTATYEAFGNEVRVAPSTLEQINYNANIANDTDNIINKIEAHGIEVDWIRGRIDNGDWGINFTDGTMSIGTLTVDEITGNFGVTRITGSIVNGDWSIDFDNGTMSIGTLAVGKITGSITNGGWGIDFTNGTMSIGTLAVSNITGSLSNVSTSGNSWGINFTDGTMNIGTLAVSRITGSKSLGNNWSLDFDNGTLTIGNVSANNITAGTISGAVTATNFTLEGGRINIEAASDSDNAIRLYYRPSASQLYYSELTPTYIRNGDSSAYAQLLTNGVYAYRTGFDYPYVSLYAASTYGALVLTQETMRLQATPGSIILNDFNSTYGTSTMRASYGREGIEYVTANGKTINITPVIVAEW